MFNVFNKPQADAILIAKLQIKRHESCRLKMYKDSKGINTIGWGFNLDANEIPQEVADLLLDYMFEDAVAVAKDYCGEVWNDLNEARKAVIINLAYNMGRKTLFSLWTFQTAVKSKNWDYGAARLMSYAWFKDVGIRGAELVKQWKTGEVA